MKDDAVFYIAEFPFESKHADELSLKKGDIIRLVSKECNEDGYWVGVLNGKEGLFPNNFVKMHVTSVGFSYFLASRVQIQPPSTASPVIQPRPTPPSTNAPPQLPTSAPPKQAPPVLVIKPGQSTSLLSQDHRKSSPVAPASLTHMTADRPKAPKTRRPPSSSFLTEQAAKAGESLDGHVSLNKYGG